MIVNGIETDAMGAIYAAKEKRRVSEIKLKQEQERLRIKIIVDWKQGGSVGFWKKCFKQVPFKIIKSTYLYIIYLEETKYEVRNPAGLFVTMLRKQGFFPFKEVIESEPVGN